MSIQCPKCGATASSVSVLKHEDNCAIICVYELCASVAVRETYLVRLCDGMRLQVQYCRRHLDFKMITNYDKPFDWEGDVWVWDSNHA